MMVKAKDVQPGDRVVFGDRTVMIDMTGPTGITRGSCVLFVTGEETGVSIGRDVEVQVVRPDAADRLSFAPIPSVGTCVGFFSLVLDEQFGEERTLAYRAGDIEAIVKVHCGGTVVDMEAHRDGERIVSRVAHIGCLVTTNGEKRWEMDDDVSATILMLLDHAAKAMPGIDTACQS